MKLGIGIIAAITGSLTILRRSTAMRLTVLGVVYLTFLMALPVVAQVAMETQTIAAGGRNASSASYNLRCTLGQVAIGIGTDPSYILELGFWHAVQNVITDVNPLDPYIWKLDQNHPNPFNPMTTISYELTTESHVRLTIYNVRGELVKTLMDETQLAGRHSLYWDGRDNRGVEVASGVYFLRLLSAQGELTRKMTLAR